MSEFMIHRKNLRQCGGDLENSVKIRTTEQSSAEDIINLLEEVTTRTRIGSSRVNLKTRFNTPWKDSLDKNPKENSNNIKYKSVDVIQKLHIFQRTTHLANTCPKKGKINEIDIEKEPNVEKDEVHEDNPDDKSSIFSEYSKDIENINATFDIMESYSHLPQLNNGQLDLSKIQDSQLMKTKPNRGKVKKVSQDNLELEKFKSLQLNEDEISLHLTDKQESELHALSYDHKEAFASDKEPLVEIFCHEVDIILNIERPHPPLLRRPAYPESPKSREALEIHIKELLDLGVIRKVGRNEEIEIGTPVIVAWHNGKSRMAGDFRSLNTDTVLDRYPIPKIQISLTQISQEVYISTIDSLKGVHQNVVTPRDDFCIKNAPSHFQIMMNEILPEELSEGWFIIYIDDIIVCSKTWEEHIYRLSRDLNKIQSVNVKICLNKCHFGFKELKALGHVVSGLLLGIDKSKVSAVLLKPMPQKKKEIQ
ncbi:hypothetical protein O181_055853 [Austropuccinia psidii MF-1]|uniref:Reverse transcriptase domain-containing protein n=1 Tax=Austropuccinia psidii MF-1 TaxID=1389203 RepID=A0A9Q3E8K1_9BASI|nr:hypothetical protein [Austropuccinia psidii MF-1]